MDRNRTVVDAVIPPRQSNDGSSVSDHGTRLELRHGSSVHPVCLCCVHLVCLLCTPCRPCRDGSSASGRGVLSMQGLSHGVTVLYTLYVCVVYILYVCCVHPVGHVVTAAVRRVVAFSQCKASVMEWCVSTVVVI